MSTASETHTVENAIVEFEYRLAMARQDWDAIVERLRTNPNAMNVLGIWQGATLDTLRFLQIYINVYDGVVRELRQAQPKPTVKPTPKRRKGKS